MLRNVISFLSFQQVIIVIIILKWKIFKVRKILIISIKLLEPIVCLWVQLRTNFVIMIGSSQTILINLSGQIQILFILAFRSMTLSYYSNWCLFDSYPVLTEALILFLIVNSLSQVTNHWLLLHTSLIKLITVVILWLWT